ncbi:helix-turn-helix domain-containing protein [Saccharothrix sp. AJ9571]|nr:helix-turn-helix domain-containing protein [Saccharothrix sp. AJ9571]
MIDDSNPAEIGARIERIRKRRGLSLEQAAGLAGIGKTTLAYYESGERRIGKRKTLENLAAALTCAVTDITGEPYRRDDDRMSVEALATLPPISAALLDCTFDDVPDSPARPVAVLARLARTANAASADSRYSIAGQDLGTLLTELHIQAVTGSPNDQRAALAALAEACIVAVGTARSLGNPDLAATAAQRAQDAAQRLEDAALEGFTAMSGAIVLGRLGARRRARRVAEKALQAVEHADPTATDTAPAEAAGMLHLASAQLAAKADDRDTAADHLRAAEELATRTGERSTLYYDFGPANVQAWSLTLAVEADEGPERAETIVSTPGYDEALVSDERKAALYFDLARAFAQAEGARDIEAGRYLDLADRTAPLRIRHDPLARELVDALEGRAQRRTWELSSLSHRIKARSQIVND